MVSEKELQCLKILEAIFRTIISKKSLKSLWWSSCIFASREFPANMCYAIFMSICMTPIGQPFTAGHVPQTICPPGNG